MPVELFDTKKVFNATTLAHGTAIYVIGYDDMGSDFIGNYIVTANQGHKLNLTGVKEKVGITTTRVLPLEFVEEGMVKVHVYEKPNIPFPKPEPECDPQEVPNDIDFEDFKDIDI